MSPTYTLRTVNCTGSVGACQLRTSYCQLYRGRCSLCTHCTVMCRYSGSSPQPRHFFIPTLVYPSIDLHRLRCASRRAGVRVVPATHMWPLPGFRMLPQIHTYPFCFLDLFHFIATQPTGACLIYLQHAMINKPYQKFQNKAPLRHLKDL